MTAEIGQDEAESRLCERVARAMVEPVRSRAHEAVQEDQRPTRPGLAVCELHAVMAGELENVHSVPDPRRVASARSECSGHAAWKESERLRCHYHRRRSGSPWWLLQNSRLYLAVRAIPLCACQRADRRLCAPDARQRVY